MNNTLPTDDLKKYGIIESDNSFSKKLTADDIQQFLNGFTMVVDNEKTRVTFQLTDSNSQLKVNLFEREKDLTQLLEDSKKEIQYSDTFSRYNVNDKKNNAQLGWSKTAFIFDEKEKIVKEYDVIKNVKLVTEKVAETKNANESNRYKKVLLQLKSFLQDKIEQYPEIAKVITADLNIIINEISAVDSISRPDNQIEKEGKDDVQLNVNDPDRYEDANRHREEQFEEEEEDLERPRGFKR